MIGDNNVNKEEPMTECNNELHKHGLPMPRTCAKCGLGDCTEYGPFDSLPTYSQCNQSDNQTLEYKFRPQGIQIKFKPTGFRVGNEGSISVDISVDLENEVGCPQYLLIGWGGETLAVTKDCLYQLYLAACELQK